MGVTVSRAAYMRDYRAKRKAALPETPLVVELRARIAELEAEVAGLTPVPPIAWRPPEFRPAQKCTRSGKKTP